MSQPKKLSQQCLDNLTKENCDYLFDILSKKLIWSCSYRDLRNRHEHGTAACTCDYDGEVVVVGRADQIPALLLTNREYCEALDGFHHMRYKCYIFNSFDLDLHHISEYLLALSV